jgi:SMC interacting uncharacterized protein involved in chromosome segregation
MRTLSETASKIAHTFATKSTQIAQATKKIACSQFATLDSLCKEKLRLSCKEVAGYTIITVLVGTVVVQCYKFFKCSSKQKEAIAIWKKYVIDAANCTEEAILNLSQELPADIETMQEIISNYCYQDEREQFSAMLGQIRKTAPAIIEMANNIKKARFENAAQKLEQEIHNRYAHEFECLENNGDSAILHKEVAGKFGFEKYSYINYHIGLLADIARVKAFAERLSEIMLLLEKLDQVTNELFRDSYKQEYAYNDIDSRFDHLDSKMGNLDSKLWQLQNEMSGVTYSVSRLKSDLSHLASKIH